MELRLILSTSAMHNVLSAISFRYLLGNFGVWNRWWLIMACNQFEFSESADVWFWTDDAMRILLVIVEQVNLDERCLTEFTLVSLASVPPNVRFQIVALREWACTMWTLIWLLVRRIGILKSRNNRLVSKGWSMYLMLPSLRCELACALSSCRLVEILFRTSHKSETSGIEASFK